MEGKKILFNRARCRRCGTFLESKTVHDFRTCACGAISIDGGREYIHHVAVDWDFFEDLCEYEELIDPHTGVKLTPSWHGEDCQGNGTHPGVECCCDECDYLMICWEDYKPGRIWDETEQKWI